MPVRFWSSTQMKIKVKIYLKEESYFKATIDVPTKDLKDLGLFGAIDKKTKSFNPIKVLIL